MTTPRTAAEAFADAAAAMVSDHHVGDVLAQLVADCAELTSSDAIAVLVQLRPGELSLLSATSHEAALLEMLQAQSGTGPCVDCIEQGERICAAGTEMLTARWPEIGQSIIIAGYQSVDAFPMRWRGRTIGGLNVFRSRGDDEPANFEVVCQAFADVATLVLVQSSEVPQDQITARVHEAVSARVQVEQAKGVLAHLHHLELPAAYERLRFIAGDGGRSLTETARRIVREQHEHEGRQE